MFTQMSKAFHRAVAMQASFFKHLGDIATVLLDLSFFMQSQIDSMMVSSDKTSRCQTPSAYKNLTGLLQIMAKRMFWKCKLIFSTDKLQQNI